MTYLESLNNKGMGFGSTIPSYAAISGVSAAGRASMASNLKKKGIKMPSNIIEAAPTFWEALTEDSPWSANSVKSVKKGVSIPRSSSGSGSGSYYSSSGPIGGGSPSSAAQFEYYAADLAKRYGMSKETAYAEALENTAYQRSIQDMKAAGLNPAVIYGAGRGTPAGGVSYIRTADSGGPGGGGGYRRRSYSGSGKSSKSGYLFDQGTWGALSTIGGFVGMAAMKSPVGFWIGQTAAQGIMGAFNNMFGKK